MSTNVKISIITINYNGYSDTCSFVDSIREHLKVPYELIVVDNCSNNDEGGRIKQRYGDEIKVILSSKNLGFSGGNNLGIEASSGNYLLIINNDTIIEDNSISYLIDCLDAREDIGGASPKIKFAFAPRNIQFAGFTELSAITLRNSVIGYNLTDNGEYDIAHETPYLHGAAMLIKRNVIEKVGLMPEIYFLYYEEIDWSTTIREGGYKLWYEPRCTIFHKESRSTGIDSPLKAYYLTRNRLIYTSRHRRGLKKHLSIAYQIAIAATKNIIKYSLKRKGKQAIAIFNGCKNYIFK